MPKQPKTLSLEIGTIRAIERLATETRRNQGAIVDLAIEAYIKLQPPQQPPTLPLAAVSQSSLNRGNSNTDEYRAYDAYQASLKAAAEKHGACPRCEAPLMPTQNNNERWCGNCKVAFPLAEVQPLKEAA